MSNDVTPGHEPERPRAEPEIIGPGEAFRPQRDRDNIFMQFEGRDGVHRIFIARPGWPAIMAALLIFGLFAAIVFVVLAGIVVLWIPIVILGVLAAIVPATARMYWGRIKGFLSGGR
jgi:hypothetical protein